MQPTRRSTLRLATLAALALAPVAEAQHQVWTVDDDGPADFADLQPAIDAAADGDALLVRGGAYGIAAIDGKGLVLLAEDGGTIGITTTSGPCLAVRNLAHGQTVLVLGAKLTATPTFPGGPVLDPCLTASNLDAMLWVQDASVIGRGGMIVDDGVALLRDADVRGLEAYRSIFAGSNDGVRVIGGSLLAYGGELEGAFGQNAGCIIGFSCGNPGTGGSGLRLLSTSVARLSGVDVAGGDGEWSVCDSTSWGDAGSGGDAIHLETGSAALAIDSTFTPGAAGVSLTVCADGAPGQVQSGGGTLMFSAEPRRSLEATSLVREGQPIHLVFRAPAGEVAWLGLSLRPVPFEAAGFDGPLILGSPRAELRLVPMPASGELAFGVLAPQLPAGVQHLPIYLQPVFVSPAGGRFAGDPTAVVVLDGAL